MTNEQDVGRVGAGYLTVHGKPLVPVFAFGELDDFAETTTAESGVGELFELP